MRSEPVHGRQGLRAAAQARGAAAFRAFVARSDDRRLERTFGSRAGLRGLFAALPGAFSPERAALLDDVAGELCCELRTADGALRVWTLEIAPERVRARPGRGSDPRLTVKLSAVDFVRIAGGDLDAGSALLSGRIDLEGDVAFAMALGALVERR